MKAKEGSGAQSVIRGGRGAGHGEGQQRTSPPGGPTPEACGKIMGRSCVAFWFMTRDTVQGFPGLAVYRTHS